MDELNDRQQDDSITLKALVNKSFLIVSVIIFLSAFVLFAYLNYSDTESRQMRNAKTMHRTISALVNPALEISNISEVRKILSLAAGRGEVVSVIQSGHNYVLSDYERSGLVKEFNKMAHGMLVCPHLSNSSMQYQGKKYFVYCTMLRHHVVKVKESVSYGLLVSFSPFFLFSFSHQLIIQFIIFAIVVLMLMNSWHKRMIRKRLIKPLLALRDEVTEFTDDSVSIRSSTKYEPKEVRDIRNNFGALLKRFRLENEKRLESERKVTLSEVSLQIAHDIRSPLAALDASIKDLEGLEGLSDERKELIYRATQRINDIANNLLICSV